MKNFLQLKSLIALLLVFMFINVDAQIKPMTICLANSLSPSTINVAYLPDTNPIITVATTGNCTTYTVSTTYSWITYTKSNLRVTIIVATNTGPARSGTVTIGGLTLQVNQDCGNFVGAAGTITGTNSVCPGQNTVTYSVSPITNATTYTWSLPSGASFASGYNSNSNSIAVDYSANAISGNISVYGTSSCGNGTSSSLPVTVNSIAQPGTITGTPSVCSGSTYTYSVTPVTGATSYSWTLPSGATGSSSTNSINVTFGSNSGTISVIAYNSAGCASQPSTLLVSISTLSIYSVSGGGNSCPSSGVTVGLTGSNSGIQYNCYLNGSLLTPSITGTGSAISFGPYITGGTYTIKGVTSAGCLIPMSGSATIVAQTNSTAPTSINATATTVCPGVSTTLTPNGGSLGTGASWKWYTGSCGGTLVYTGSSFVVSPAATTTYYLRAEGACQPTACVSITITVTTPPTITVQPANVTICDGASTSFSVTATGASSYQWQNYIGSTWTNISGATSSTYSIASTTGMNGRAFRCVVSGPCSLTTTSNSATITFSTLTSYNVTGGGGVCPGSSVAIGLSGSTSGIQYKLYLGGSFQSPAVTGTGSAISFGNKSTAGTYTVNGVTSIGCEIPMSGNATITAQTNSTAPSSINATATTVCPGGSTTLTPNGGSLGTGASWKWYTGSCGGTLVYTGSSFTVSPVATTTYYLRGEGTCLPSSCVSTTINVTTAPVITVQPANVTICAGAATSFSVTATGASSYQWQNYIGSTWTNISGATSTTYSIASTAGMNGMVFRCVVSGPCSLSTNSNSANITFSTLTAYNVTGGGLICPSSSSVIGLDGSASGIQYKLYLNGTFQSPAITGTGSAISFGNKSTGGTYTVTGVTSVGCEIPMNGSAIISLRTPSTPASSISTTNNNFCQGGAAVLSVIGGSLESGYGSWKWYSGTAPCGSTPEGEGPSINVHPNSTTTYFVRAEGGCVSTSCVSITINVTQIPTIVNQPVNTSVQVNQTATFSFTATGSNLVYQWQSSDSGNDPWTDLSGLPAHGYNTSSLSIDNVVASKYFRCRITSNSCSTYSNSAEVSLYIPGTGYLEGSNIPDPNTRTLNKSLSVGTLPGSINVNDFGASTYQIPLFTSPGTADMKPNLSIVYNSMRKDGLLGIGWDLVGLSTIQRVPQDIYHDGQVVGITLQNTDRFALDSNRLVLSSGTYGSSGSVYRTEIETFAQITAHESAGTGPGWFEVKTKDGRTIEYGNTITSKVEAPGSSTVYQWRINKITDQSGNYITFSYIENNGESYIDYIEYTGNLVTPILPYNKIKFGYGSKTDSNCKYVGGSKIPNTVLLTSVQMILNPDTLVHKYEFRYSLDFYTHLSEIVETGLNNESLNSTVIGWGASGDQFSHSDVFSNTTSNIFYKGDFNGDGRTDFIVTENKTTFTTTDKWALYLAASNGTSFVKRNDGFLSSSFKSFIVTDANGDGKAEVFWKEFESGSYQCNPHLCSQSLISKDSTLNSMTADTTRSQSLDDVILLNPQSAQDTCYDVCYHNNVRFLYYVYNEQTGLVRGSTSNDLIYNDCPSDLTLKPADLDGNGIMDYVVLDMYSQLYRISGVIYNGTKPFLTDIKIIDFDGDKRDEIFTRTGNNSLIYQYDPANESFTTIYSSSSFPTSSDRIFTGDFNGDKKTDILSWNNGWSLKFSTGTGFTNSSNTPTLINTDPEASMTDNNFYISDINGDGKDDIVEVYIDGNASRIKIFYSQGNGIFSVDDNSYTKPVINQDYITFGDFNGDGKEDLFYYDYSSPSNTVNVCFFRKDEMKHFVSSLANGLNQKTWINYSRINANSGIYTEHSAAQFPVIDYNGPFYVVDSTWVNDGTGLEYLKNHYSYEGANIHRQGKGFLGFRKLISTNNVRDSIFTWREFDYNPTYFYIYPSKSSTWFKYTNNKLTESVNTFSTINFQNNVIFPYISETLSTDFDKSFSVHSTYGYDNYGNMTSNSTENRSGSTVEATSTVSNTYAAFGNYGIANKLTSTTATSVYGAEPAYSRSVSYSYDALGKLLTEITDPQKDKAVTKTYSDFNNFGLPKQITLSANGLDSRTTTIKYDQFSRFVTRITNPLADSISKCYDQGTGNIKSEKGIDGNITSYHYDNFGRLIQTITPQGNTINSSTFWDMDGSDGENSLYYSLTTSPQHGIPDQYVYYDLAGRKILTKTTGFDGQPVQQRWKYSPGGVLVSTSYPYKNGDSIKLNKYYYDFYGRVRSEDNNGLITNTQYINNRTSVTDPAGHVKSSTINSTGKVVQVNDIGTDISYTYSSNGEPKSVTTAGTTVSFSYDDYGQKTSVLNSNSGTTSYNYNAYGELISQTDAKSQAYTFHYDILGRMDRKVGPEGITKYKYQPNGNGIEKVKLIKGPNETSQSFSYNAFGQLTCRVDTIPGTPDLITNFEYDSWGHNTGITYPSGAHVTNSYNRNGYLRKIINNGKTVWALDSINSLGQPVQYSFGRPGVLKTNFSYDSKFYLTRIKTKENIQGYSFNPYTGNLSNRSYINNANDTTLRDTLYEGFTYDLRDRLKTYKTDNQVQYDDNGNILYKPDVGTYDYSGSGINAVTSITGYNSLIADTAAQKITYTGFNMTNSVELKTFKINYTYGPDNQRVKFKLYNNGNLIKTKYYSPGYERVITQTDTTELTYITSPFGIVAVIIKKSGVDSVFYTETDHLGSIIGLLKDDGTYRERYSYDAWGHRRNPYTWRYDTIQVPTIIDRGYTGHEHLDLFGLINMNGRMYDPIVGRFLGVDPIIQDGTDSQSFNGYSYCFNNPLKYVDPSGYVMDDPWSAFIRASNRGFTGSYSNFSDQYYDQYYDYMFDGGGGGVSGAGGGSTSMTFSWHTWDDVNYWDSDGLHVTSKRIDHNVTFQVSLGENKLNNKEENADSGGDYPFEGAIIADRFHLDRPELGIHDGVDFKGKEGIKVKSVSNGIVRSFVKYQSELTKGKFGGVYVQIANGGYITYYAHLKEGSTSNLSVGLYVNKGDVIGEVGNTGRCVPSDYYHLHLQVWEDGNYNNQYDPLVIYPFLNH